MTYPILEKEFCGHPYHHYDATPRWPFDDQEPPMLKYWHRIKPRDVVEDIGAGLGVYSVTASLLGAEVIAYEPSQECRNLLWDNGKLNGQLIACLNIALSDDAPPLDLEAEVFGRHYPATNVQHFAMDFFLTPYTRCDWLKIDVEGAELHVIRGALETLRRCKPLTIIEDHQDMAPGNIVSDYPASIRSSETIQEILRGLGYELDIMRPEGGGRRWIVGVHPEVRR